MQLPGSRNMPWTVWQNLGSQALSCIPAVEGNSDTLMHYYYNEIDSVCWERTVIEQPTR